MEPLTAAIAAGTAVGFLSSVPVAWLLYRVRSTRRALERAVMELADERSARTTLTQRASDLDQLLERALDDGRAQRSKISSLSETLDATRAELEQRRLEVEQLTADLANAKKTARRAVDANDALEDQFRRARNQVAALQQDLNQNTNALHDALNEESSARRAAEQRLASIGLPISDDRRAPFSDRPGTAAALRELLVNASVDGAALVSDSGLTWMSAGVGSEALAPTNAALRPLCEASSAILCDGITEVSVFRPVGASHFLRLDDALWLGATNRGDAPRFALHAARLRIVGSAPVQPAVVDIPGDLPETTDSLDADLQSVVRAWARRWSADVAVLGADGHSLATTEADLSGPLLHLRRQASDLLVRARRDRFPISSLSWLVRSSDAALQVAPVEDGLETPIVVTISNEPLSLDALEELTATVRWQLSTTQRIAS